MNEYKNSIKKEFSNFDFLILPSTFSRAPRIGSIEKDDTSLIWTAIGFRVLIFQLNIQILLYHMG